MPLEPFESLELFGDFSVLELVFLRRKSLKKGIVGFMSIMQRGPVSLTACKEQWRSWRRVWSGIDECEGRLMTEDHSESCWTVFKRTI